MIRRLFREHPFIVMHVALLCLLSLGLVERTDLGYLHWLLLYAGAVIAVYTTGLKLTSDRKVPVPRNLLGADRLVPWVLLFLPLFATVHWWRSGGPPTLQAIMAADELTTSALRDAPKHESWQWLNYGSLLLISAVLLFTIAMAYMRKHRLFIWLLTASMIYAASLLPKSYVVVIVIPLAVLFIAERAWVRLVLTGPSAWH